MNWKKAWRNTKSFVKRHRVGIAAGLAGVGCGVISMGVAGAFCAAGVGMIAGGAAKKLGNRKASWGSVGRAAIYGGGVAATGWGLSAGARYGAGRALVRWFPRGGKHAASRASHRKSWSWRW